MTESVAGDSLEPSLSDLLGLPPFEYVVFDSPPLVLALCQVRFPAVLSIASDAFIAPFQEAIRERYPLTSKQLDLAVGIRAAEGVSGRAAPKWKFSDPQDNWAVVLAPDYVTLETRAYENFAQFVERITEIISATQRHVRPALWTRLGLRYINEIRLTDERGAADVVTPHLSALISGSTLAQQAWRVQVVQQASFRFPEGLGVTMTHGVIPEGSTVEAREGDAPPVGPFYLLDFDAFRDVPESEARTVSAEEICKGVQGFNEALYRLFRSSVTDPYTLSLGVKHAG